MPKIFKTVLVLLIPFFLLSVQLVAFAQIQTTEETPVSVEASIPPRAVDYQFHLTSDKGSVDPNESIEYTVSYGSSLKIQSSFTIEAEWTRASIQGKNNYVFDILSYQTGTATQAHGSTSPSVDLVNRKISWDLTNFPAGTKDKTIKFKLKTVSSSPTSEKLEFSVKARLKRKGDTLKEDRVDHTFPFEAKAITVTPTPTPTPLPPTSFESLNMSANLLAVTNDSIKIRIRANEPFKITLSYGETTQLGQAVTDLVEDREKVVTIDGLKPGTTYYLKASLTAREQTFTSTEFFLVKTSSQSLIDTIDEKRLLISTQGIALKNEATAGEKIERLTLPQTGVDLFIPLEEKEPAEVYIRVVNAKVLGITNNERPSFLERIRLLETEAGTFSGKIITPPISGTYSLILEIKDLDGNYLQEELMKLVVSDPVKITSTACPERSRGKQWRGSEATELTISSSFKRGSNFFVKVHQLGFGRGVAGREACRQDISEPDFSFCNQKPSLLIVRDEAPIS